MGTLLTVAIQNKRLANDCADRHEALVGAVRNVLSDR
jgi:hypothetical protein